MDDLKFPIYKDPQPEPPILSMDEYIDFCQFHLDIKRENGFDKEAYWEQKKLMAVDVPFRLLDENFG